MVSTQLHSRAATFTSPVATTVETDWRRALPTLTGSSFTLRELRSTDAASLLAISPRHPRQ